MYRIASGTVREGDIMYGEDLDHIGEGMKVERVPYNSIWR